MKKKATRARKSAAIGAPGYRLARLAIDRLDAESGLIKVEVLAARADRSADGLLRRMAKDKSDDLSNWDRATRATRFTSTKRLHELLGADKTTELAENMVFVLVEPGASKRYPTGKALNATSMARQLAKSLYRDASRVAGQ